jgi:hypothetical protein
LAARLTLWRLLSVAEVEAGARWQSLQGAVLHLRFSQPHLMMHRRP